MYIVFDNDDDNDEDDNDDSKYHDDTTLLIIFCIIHSHELCLLQGDHIMMWGSITPGAILVISLVVVSCHSDLPSYRTIHRSDPYADIFSCKSSDDWHFCFEDKCKCCGHIARCEEMTDLCDKDHPDHSCYLPSLPQEITTLDLSRSFTQFPVLLTKEFFANVTQITNLDFSFNRVSKITENTFEELQNLTTLVCNSMRIRTGSFPFLSLRPLSLLKNLEIMNLKQTDYDIVLFYFYLQTLIILIQIFSACSWMASLLLVVTCFTFLT